MNENDDTVQWTNTEEIFKNMIPMFQDGSGMTDSDKLKDIASKADYSGLVPPDFYVGIEGQQTLDAGEINAAADQLSYCIQKFTIYLKERDLINAEDSEYADIINQILSSGALEETDITEASTFTVALAEFAALVGEFSALMKSFMENFNPEGTSSSGGSSGSSYAGSYTGGSYDVLGDYNFEDDVEVVAGDFTDEEEFTEEEIKFDEDEEVKEEEGSQEEEVKEEVKETVPETNTGNNGSSSGETDDHTVNGNRIIDEVKDASGKTVAVSVIGDDKKVWYQVVNDEVIVPKEAMTNYRLPQDVTITVDGQEKTIGMGNYPVDEVIYNADGSIRSVRLVCDDVKVWAYLDSNGNIIKYDYIGYKNGYITISNPIYDKIDSYGNNIGKFSSGTQSFSEVMYDSKGNAVAYKLSADGAYEEWFYPNGNTNDASIKMIDVVKTTDKASVALESDNKGLYGLLGVLFVALGATLVVRKKIKNKENADLGDSEDYSEDSYTEESLPAGNYRIYDVKKNDEGEVTQARINPVDSSDEYWVEV